MVSPHKVTRKAAKSKRKGLIIRSVCSIGTLELPPLVEIELCTYIHWYEAVLQAKFKVAGEPYIQRCDRFYSPTFLKDTFWTIKGLLVSFPTFFPPDKTFIWANSSSFFMLSFCVYLSSNWLMADKEKMNFIVRWVKALKKKRSTVSTVSKYYKIFSWNSFCLSLLVEKQVTSPVTIKVEKSQFEIIGHLSWCTVARS